MHTYARTCMHHAEVRRQPAGLALSLQHVGPAGWTQAVRQAPLSTEASLQSRVFRLHHPFTVMHPAALHRCAHTFPVLSPFGLGQAILSWFTLLPLKFALCSTSKFCLTLFLSFSKPLEPFFFFRNIKQSINSISERIHRLPMFSVWISCPLCWPLRNSAWLCLNCEGVNPFPSVYFNWQQGSLRRKAFEISLLIPACVISVSSQLAWFKSISNSGLEIRYQIKRKKKEKNPNKQTKKKEIRYLHTFESLAPLASST